MRNIPYVAIKIFPSLEIHLSPWAGAFFRRGEYLNSSFERSEKELHEKKEKRKKKERKKKGKSKILRYESAY